MIDLLNFNFFKSVGKWFNELYHGKFLYDWDCLCDNFRLEKSNKYVLARLLLWFKSTLIIFQLLRLGVFRCLSIHCAEFLDIFCMLAECIGYIVKNSIPTIHEVFCFTFTNCCNIYFKIIFMNCLAVIVSKERRRADTLR